MKRLTLPLLATSLLVAAAPAQAQQLQLGMRAGVNSASSDTEGSAFTEQPGTETAYHFGALARVDISNWFSLQTEVRYSRKGFAEGDGDVALKVNYFEIPVLAVIRLPTTLSPHLYLGPVLSLESRCTVLFEGEQTDCEEAREAAPRTKGADSGILFGGGIAVDFGPGSVIADLMYNHGLSDISERSDNVDSIKTRTWYFSAGYMLTLGP